MSGRGSSPSRARSSARYVSMIQEPAVLHLIPISLRGITMRLGHHYKGKRPPSTLIPVDAFPPKLAMIL